MVGDACLHTGLPHPQELRRGADAAAIYSLALSRSCEWLAVSSDKGTVHVFALEDQVRAAPRGVRVEGGWGGDVEAGLFYRTVSGGVGCSAGDRAAWLRSAWVDDRTIPLHTTTCRCAVR